jgi:hypothetical protein
MLLAKKPLMGQGPGGSSLAIRGNGEDVTMQGLTNYDNHHQYDDNPMQAMLEVTRLPFSVCVIDAETHLCAICLFKYRYTLESKQRSEEPMTCKGCDIL